MARPQIFISSTFYDLRHIRTSLEGFIERLGYAPVLSEKGKIAYDPEIPLDISCYRDAAIADIFVLIIGGRYGSAASGESLEGRPDFYERYESITRKEYEAAVAKDIPTYILVDRSVFSEYETFRKNRTNSTIEYAHVESVNIFRLIDDILGQRKNNPLQQFDRHTDIEDWLREQWAGLFREFISRRSEQKQLATLSERVEELSTINTSLQRYMEAVISRISATPQEASKIISEEKERQITEKMRREFSRCIVVREALNENSYDLEEIENFFTDATHFEDLVQVYSDSTDRQKYIIDFWHENEVAQHNLNDARHKLGLPDLHFRSDPDKDETNSAINRTE